MDANEDILLAVVIPAFNEESTIKDVIVRTHDALSKISTCRSLVIVVDDGSTDRTVELARCKRVVLVSHTHNMGVGRAFKTGVEAALSQGADIIVNMDADGQFNPMDLPILIEPIQSGRADFATASRFKDQNLVPVMPKAKLIGNHLMSYLISTIAGMRLYDVSCGFRAYSRHAALNLNLWGDFTYTQESILDLSVKGVRIVEVPLQIEGERRHGESKMASNLWRYGYKTFRIILHSFLDYWPGRFFGLLSIFFWVPGGGSCSSCLCIVLSRAASVRISGPVSWGGPFARSE